MSDKTGLIDVINVTLSTKFPNTPPTIEQVTDISNAIRNKMVDFFPVSDDEFEHLLRQITSTSLVLIDNGMYIFKDDSEHRSWYPTKKADLDMFYWGRYSKYLSTIKGWNPRIVSQLNKVTDEIMDLLGDPTKQGNFQRRGLLLGDVQSGKTANYTAICNKAADCGYKVIIILAGLMENLRVQTQERLDAEFAGRQSKFLLDPSAVAEIKNLPYGVGKIPPYDNKKRIACFTTVSTDFNANIVRSNDLTLRNINEASIFVVKKNKGILNNLYNWLVSNNADLANKIDLPLLLIDDEADNASINTNRDDQDPTAINDAIRNILASFTKTSYLGITATPYANIFIDPETKEGKIDDLFPRDFIYVLPLPTNYIGPDSLFGSGYSDVNMEKTDGKFSSSIVNIMNSEMENILPFKHKKDFNLICLPDSLYEATSYFLLCNLTRDLRGDLNSHRSMLINISRFTDIHEKISEILEIWLFQLKQDVKSYCKCEQDQWRKIRSIRYLEEVWDKYAFKNLAEIEWGVALSEYLNKSIQPIEIRVINQRSGAATLNYSISENGLRVIAIGGNSLSRGLTLEGLCVSYFYRNSKMYDTLLQMGRWFGYRTNYEDLFKVWMAEEAVGWFSLITDATNELKVELERMRSLNLTPEQFGLKVRQDPNSLIVTARNKMRLGTQITIPVEVSGRVVETPRLKSDTRTLEENEKVFRSFLRSLDEISDSHEFSGKTRIWRNVQKNHIANLVRNFESHPWHLAFQSSALADYIEINSGLDNWDVALPQGESNDLLEFEVGEEKVSIHPQERRATNDGNIIRVGGSKVRVGSGGLTKIGLSEDQIKEILSSLKGDKKKYSQSDTLYLIPNRNPILFLHCLKWIDDDESTRIKDYLYAIALGFPSTGREVKTLNYVVNVNEVKNWEGFYLGEDELNDIDN